MQQLSPEEQAREQKLPKWAQEELLVLRNKVEYLTKRIEEVGVGGQTRVTVEPFGPVPLSLADGSMVRFHVGPNKNDFVDVEIRGARLDLMGGSRVIVHPEATNHIQLQMRAL